MSLFAELKRRNVFKVAAAYIIIAWLTMQVGDTLAPALLLPAWINSALAFFLILGLPLAVFFAWAFEITPDGIKKENEVDRSQSITPVTSQKLNNMIIGLLVLALSYFMLDKFLVIPGLNTAEIGSATQTVAESAPVQSPVENDKSIAVLPFVNMSDDPSNEYFSDGISEEILNALAKVQGLKVAGRTSSFAFKGKDDDLRVIGEALGVKHILEGSVRKSGNQVRITAQLIKASDGFHLWSETFDRDLTDIFAIQDEIAGTILAKLKLELIGKQDQQLTSATTNVQTYELYLRARQLMNKRDLESIQLAEQLLRQAIARDENYAPAYAQLGIVTILTSDHQYGPIPLQQVLETALPLLEKAVSLDPDLAEGWAGLGLYYSNVPGNLDTAVEHLRKSLTLNPNQIDPSNWLQYALRSQGKLAESGRLLEQINELEPLYRPAIFNLVLNYFLTNQLDKSLALVERSKRILPNDLVMVAVESAHYLLSKQPVEIYKLAEANYQATPSDRGVRMSLSIALLQLRENERLAEIGIGWPHCDGLTRLRRVEEATAVCYRIGTNDLEEGIARLFNFLVSNGRESELIRYVQKRWDDLDAFEEDVRTRDGFAHQTLGHIARAYQLLGNESMFQDAMQRFRAGLDYQRTNGADSYLMEAAEGYYFTLAGDYDSALTHMERASEYGLKYDLQTSDYWPVYKALDGLPRFEALKADGQKEIEAERKELRLAPLSS